MNLVENLIYNNYRIIRKIATGTMSDVYLAHDLNNREIPTAIKVLRTGNISSRIEDIIRFRNEASIVSSLSHPNIIAIKEIGELEGFHNKLYYIAMEYFDALSLDAFTRKTYNITIPFIVNIIKQVLEALEYIHAKGIIHRDLKPSNIMITNVEDADSASLKLIDFGVSRVKDYSNIEDSEKTSGTFAYMSPEQCGVIKGSVNESSELYSVGIIFYQLLTGEPPFQGDCASVIHQQIGAKPRIPSEIQSSIPTILEKIVLKLMEKEPESRYQSAKGVLKDLDKFGSSHENFIPGLDDVPTKLNFRVKFIREEEEIAGLKDACDGIAAGKGGVILIKGEAGIGKTRLVEELRDYSYLKDNLFLSGKCDSIENKNPYGPFKDLLHNYTRTYNGYSPEKQQIIKTNVQDKMGKLGKLLLQFCPMMAPILGPCPPLVALDAEKENKRFLMVIGSFFKNLGKIEEGLILFIDDIQWIDEGSYELLYEIIQDLSKTPILFISTYRDNEITGNHCVNKLRAVINAHAYPVQQIAITRFDEGKMKRFTSQILNANSEITQELSGFLLQKSRGNPFFTFEIIKQLEFEKALCYQDGAWHLHKVKLEEIEIPATIVETLLKRIDQLGIKEKLVLSYAAIIGRKFDIDLLFRLGLGKMGVDLKTHSNRGDEDIKKEIVAIVDKAIKLQLLEEDLTERGKLLFVHDRLKEAFYKNLGKDKRKELHLEIGLIQEELCLDDRDEMVFELAYHFLKGGDKEKSLAYAYPAGLKAKESYANDEAKQYFEISLKLLEEKGLTESNQWIHVTENIAEISLLQGENDNAIKLFSRILERVESQSEKANLYNRISHAYFKKGDFANCEQHAKMSMEILGEKLPIKRQAVILRIIRELLIHFLHRLFPPLFVRRKEKPVQIKQKQIVQNYYSLGWAYILSDTLKFVSMVLRILNISESRIGPSKELGMSLVGYGTLLMAIPLFKRSIKYHQKALKLMRYLKHEPEMGESLYTIGLFYQWKGDYHKSNEYYYRCIDQFEKIGDIKGIESSHINLANNHVLLSDYKTAKTINRSLLDLANKLEDKFGICAAYRINLEIEQNKGRFDSAKEFGLKSYQLSLEENIEISRCSTCTYLGVVSYETGDITKSIEYLEEARYLYENFNLMKHYTIFLYSQLAEAYIAEYKLMEFSKSELSPETLRLKKSSLKKIEHLCQFAIKKTKPWVSHYGGSIRTYAKYLCLIGKYKKAQKLFLQSIQICSRLGRKYELGLSYYEYARLLIEIQQTNTAKINLEKAYTIFKDVDSVVYLRRTVSLLGISLEESQPDDDPQEKKRLNLVRDLSHEISAFSDITLLLEYLLKRSMEITGAHRGYLFIQDNNSNTLKLLANQSLGKPSIEEFSWSIVNRVFASGEAVITTNAQEDKEFTAYQSVADFTLKSILSIPIKSNDNKIGVCYLDNPLSKGVFGAEDLEVLDNIFSQAVISIDNAILKGEFDKIKIDDNHFIAICNSYHISKREQEIIRLMLAGKTNKEISTELHIAFATVRSHIYSIYQKTAVNTRNELVALLKSST